jgi:catechol 2,3-dioxygenase-like lactoylglutathione lyase family enzyme
MFPRRLLDLARSLFVDGMGTHVLGRFLEISVHAPNVLESLEFYQKLGFTQAEAGETWSHPYAVVTDGRLFIGLHQYDFESPSLTFVKPDLWRHVEALEGLGIEFAFRKLGNDVFNEAGFLDPDQVMVTLLEARTFSPPMRESSETSWCGYFSEIGIPTRDPDRSKDFWERLGFVATDEQSAPFRRISLTSDFLDLGLYATRDLRKPVLSFVDPEMPSRLSHIEKLGIERSQRLPAVFDPERNAMLVAPEGTNLLLATGDA